ncbi:MAG: hypothetical protein Kow0074_02430 [Candidatus Zixiibacteriota bacterium]
MTSNRVYWGLVAALLCVATTGFAQTSASGLRPAATPAVTYRMSNGMEVILQENHASPMISSIVFVKSGAKYESVYNNGATHFLEHLLFNGTATRTQDEISDRIENLGGYINAFTRKELTAYMSLVPSEYIAEALDIQQDMLFNSIFPEEQFPKERKIVIEEIHKDNDNPDYVAERFFDKWAYRGSPYERPVLGYENLISTISREEIINYYRTYYQPNNMIAMVIGDFNTAEMRDLLETTFGQHPARPLPERPEITVPPVVGKTVKRTTADVGETYVKMHIRVPNHNDPSYLPMTLLVEVLNERAMSPLYQRLVDGVPPLATQASVALETQDEFAALNFSITTDDPAKADAIIREVENLLADLPNLAVPEEDLRAIVTRLRVEELFLREKLHYYAIMRAPMVVTAGFEFIDELPDRMAQITLADIRQAAATHLTGQDYIATVVAPTPEESAEESQAAEGLSNTTYGKRQLANGMTAIVKSNPDSRVFAINVLGKHRSACEPPELVGISDFVNRMLVSGTTTRTADQISRELTAIGAELTTNDNPYIPYDDRYTTPQYTFIKFATIDEFAPKGVELLADMIGNSVFPPDEVAKVQKQVMGILGMASGSPRDAARQLFYQSLFKDGAYARPVLGTHASVMAFTSENLKSHLKTLYAPENTIVSCATNLDVEETFELLENSFGQIAKGTPPSVSPSKPITPSGEVVAHVPMDKEQVYIYIGGPLPGASNPDAPALMVAGDILSTRMRDELREKRGLAYSVGAGIDFDREFGWYMGVMGTGKTNYAEARAGILDEIRRMQETLPTDQEVEIAQNSIWGSMLTRQLARTNQAYYMGVHEFLGLGYDYLDHMIDAIRAVRPSDVQRVARQYFDPENYILATVGDLEAQ